MGHFYNYWIKSIRICFAIQTNYINNFIQNVNLYVFIFQWAYSQLMASAHKAFKSKSVLLHCMAEPPNLFHFLIYIQKIIFRLASQIRRKSYTSDKKIRKLAWELLSTLRLTGPKHLNPIHYSVAHSLEALLSDVLFKYLRAA